KFLEEFESLLAAGGIARVVEVHEHEGELARLDRLEDGGGGFYGFNLVTLGLEQQAQGLKDVGLVVGNQDAGRNIQGDHGVWDGTGAARVKRRGDPRGTRTRGPAGRSQARSWRGGG